MLILSERGLTVGTSGGLRVYQASSPIVAAAMEFKRLDQLKEFNTLMERTSQYCDFAVKKPVFQAMGVRDYTMIEHMISCYTGLHQEVPDLTIPALVKSVEDSTADLVSGQFSKRQNLAAFTHVTDARRMRMEWLGWRKAISLRGRLLSSRENEIEGTYERLYDYDGLRFLFIFWAICSHTTML